MKIKLSDYIFKYLQEKNITTAFSVSGGAAAHLLDSAKKYNIEYIANYHEQASAMAAEGYGRIKTTPALVLVTNGPGSSNTLTGVLGAFQDSIPMFVISGQVPTNQTINSQPYKLRQLGVQEVDIIKVVDSITKYSHQVIDANTIKYHLDKAYYECISGRKGPVWLDIPLNIQSTFIETTNLKGYTPPTVNYPSYNINNIIDLIFKSKNPLIVTGNGIHLSSTEKIFKKLVNKLKIPVVSTWSSKDLFDWYDPLFVGNFGLLGERAGNFAIQKSDLILILGSRLSIPNIGYKSELFSPNSTKIMVDIDENELNKPTLNIDYKIQTNLNEFIPNLINNLPLNIPNWDFWIEKNNKLKHKYPVFLPEYKTNKNKINSFYFTEVLSKYLNNQIVITDMGTSYTCTHQSLRTNGKSRLFTSSACCSMGFGLPGAIGAYFSDKTKEIILVAGDGGMQMNIQELQTIAHHNIPIKIFILNNQGYLAISLMQDNLFKSNYIGSTPDSGVSSPDFCKIAKAYGIKSTRVNNNSELENQIEGILSYNGPIICEVMMPTNQLLIPRVQSKKNSKGEIESTSLENMFPFLDDNEVLNIMK